MEFGAKVNNIQVDGISFIEHHSIEAFNESVRLKQCIGSITNRVGCGLWVDIPPVWCGCLAHVVRMLNTNGADGMHHMCEGLTPLLYM